MRAEGITTLAEANAYLENHYLPEWESLFTRRPASSDDAHRPLGKQHKLEAILCRVEHRVVTNDYTFRWGAQVYQIQREHVRPRLRGASIRVEQRHNGEIAVRFEDNYLSVRMCEPGAPAKPDKPNTAKAGKAAKTGKRSGKSRWMDGFFDRPSPHIDRAIAIANATS